MHWSCFQICLSFSFTFYYHIKPLDLHLITANRLPYIFPFFRHMRIPNPNILTLSPICCNFLGEDTPCPHATARRWGPVGDGAVFHQRAEEQATLGRGPCFTEEQKSKQARLLVTPLQLGFAGSSSPWQFSCMAKDSGPYFSFFLSLLFLLDGNAYLEIWIIIIHIHLNV